MCISDPRKQAEALSRPCQLVLPSEEVLFKRLEFSVESHGPLHIKSGFDPTAPELHFGHYVIIRLLKLCLDLGHQVDLILGTYTATIGDPSGRNKARPVLSQEEAAKNSLGLREDLALVLPLDKVRIVENAEWLNAMSCRDALEVLAKVPVSRVLERREIRQRVRRGRGARLSEMLYPLIQGYESVLLGPRDCPTAGVDIEIGAIDQLFNARMGRALQEMCGQQPQVCLLLPLLMGTDGRKMSKTAGNHLPIRCKASSMFARLMDLPDADTVKHYFALLTDVEEREVDRLIARDIAEARFHLASDIVGQIRGAESASEARAWYVRVYLEGKMPAPEVLTPLRLSAPGSAYCLRRLLIDEGMAGGVRHVQRLIGAGLVRVNGCKVSRSRWILNDGDILQVGHEWRCISIL